MINFVTAMLRFQDFAAREGMSAGEVMLFLAIFRVFNDRRWPAGAQAISNNELLVHTTFTGSGRDNTLRELRRKLAERGLIRFVPGDRRARQPEYAILWAALGMPEEDEEPEAEQENGTEFGYENIPKKDGKEDAHSNYRSTEFIDHRRKQRVKQKRARAAFVPPTVDEVREECRAIGLDINPMIFLDYYGARGWPITDWRAALRCWRERERQGCRTVSAQRYTQRSYTEEELEARAPGL